MDQGPRDDPDVVGVLLHGERLAGAGLTVGHDRRVVALEKALEKVWA